MFFAMILQFSNLSVKRTLRIKLCKYGYLKRLDSQLAIWRCYESQRTD